jgi:hypothetical protein
MKVVFIPNQQARLEAFHSPLFLLHIKWRSFGLCFRNIQPTLPLVKDNTTTRFSRPLFFAAQGGIM